MPRECPANSTVTIDRVDDDTWVVRRQRQDHGLKVIAVHTVHRLPNDPEREKIEGRLAKHAVRNLPEPA
jgi:hypothetical protein